MTDIVSYTKSKKECTLDITIKATIWPSDDTDYNERHTPKIKIQVRNSTTCITAPFNLEYMLTDDVIKLFEIARKIHTDIL